MLKYELDFFKPVMPLFRNLKLSLIFFKVCPNSAFESLFNEFCVF